MQARHRDVDEENQQGEDDGDVRSRGLMRESEIALSEVRSVYTGLEDAVKRLENVARVADLLPQIEHDGSSMLWGTPAGDEMLEQYPWFDPRINSMY